MTMSNMPGTVRQNVVAPAPSKKTGLLRMTIGSDHLVTIRPKDAPPQTVSIRVRDRRLHPRARVHFICLNPVCRAVAWKTEAELISAHPDPLTMAKQNEIHVYGMWSDDLADPAQAAEYEKAVEAAKADKKPAPAVPAGPVLGLLTVGAE